LCAYKPKIKNNMKTFLKFICIAILTVGFVSCSDDDSSESNTDETARVSIELTDAPGDYEAVFIDVEDVVVKYNGEEDEVFIDDVDAGIYNLLELTGGVSVVLVDEELPTGSISQIRLVLGDDNTVVVDGETIPLQTPSAQQSGLKIQVNETLEGGIFYEFMLDFNVEESIVEQGNGGYLLKPVIRATTVAETGAISGSVIPVTDTPVLVTTTTGEGEEISAYTDAQGKFVLQGILEGNYDLKFEADPDLNFPPVIIDNVIVEVGEITTVGEINLEL